MQSYDNEPLMLVFDEGVDHIHFFVKYLEYHKFISETTEEEYLITNLASLCGPFSQTSNALYNMSNRLRELFNLSRRIALNEHDLRRYFGYILQLSNEKLIKAVTVDKDIILFIESVDRMKDSNGTSSAKNWLPKTYPRRVKCIMTCNKAKETQITARLNCHKIFVKNKDPIENQVRAVWAPFKTEISSKEDTQDLEKKKETITDLGATIQNKTEKSKRTSHSSFQNSKDSKEKELPTNEYNNKLIDIFLGLPVHLKRNYEFACLYFGLLAQSTENRGVSLAD